MCNALPLDTQLPARLPYDGTACIERFISWGLSPTAVDRSLPWGWGGAGKQTSRSTSVNVLSAANPQQHNQSTTKLTQTLVGSGTCVS